MTRTTMQYCQTENNRITPDTTCAIRLQTRYKDQGLAVNDNNKNVIDQPNDDINTGGTIVRFRGTKNERPNQKTTFENKYPLKPILTP